LATFGSLAKLHRPSSTAGEVVEPLEARRNE
jgi:hypothetical protein